MISIKTGTFEARRSDGPFDYLYPHLISIAEYYKLGLQFFLMATTAPPRRKGPKDLPKLPASAFVPPNSATEESFPLGPDPSTVQPEAVIDANVIVDDGDITHSKWKKDAGQVLGGRIRGVVLSLPGADLAKVTKE